MARPITWQTINGRSNEGAARMLEGASDSMDSGFDIFNKLIAGTEQVQTDNRNTTIKNNTLDARSFLAGITDPEEMARVQASGEFRDRVAGYGGMVDQEALQGAADERLTGLRDMQTTNRAYDDSETRFGNRDVRDSMQADLAAGRLSAFDQKLVSNPGLLDQGELAQQRAAAAARIKQEGQSDEQYERNTETYNQGQDDRAKTKAEEAAVDMGTKRLNEIVAKADTASDARAQTQAWLQSEEAAGIPPQQRNRLQADAEPLYIQNNDFTQNQSNQLEEVKATQQARAQEVIAQQELEQQRIVEDNPVDPQLAFTSEDRVDITQAKKYAEEQVDDYWTKGNIDSAMKLVKDSRNISDRDAVPWGNLIKMAVDGAKERDVFGDDYDLDSEPMNQELMDVYDRWVETTQNKKNVREGEDALLGVRKTQTDQVSYEVKKMREALKAANKNARSLKGGK